MSKSEMIFRRFGHRKIIDAELYDTVCTCKTEEQAAFIAHACNCHYALVTALAELCELPNKKRPARVWEAARAALAQATGKE